MLAGEVTASMARHGIFPAALKSANRHGAPAWSLLLVGLLASAMIAMNYSRSMTEAFTFLTLVVTAASMPLYLVGGAAVFKLRQRGAMLAFSAVMTCVFSLWAFYGMGKEAFWWGIALGAVSLPVFWLVRWRQKAQQAEGSTPPAAAPQ